MRFIYLHGFGSGPLSRKAIFFRERFAEAGLQLEIPALDGGAFRDLTISGQLEILDHLAAGERAVLIGSSLGGYLAALYAAAHPPVERIVLLAPAFGFAALWEVIVGEAQMRAWRENGSMQVFHYQDGCERELGYQFMEDARKFDLWPAFRQPALIVHGAADDVVPLANSERMAVEHANIRLITVDSDHELANVFEFMWTATARFLGIARD